MNWLQRVLSLSGEHRSSRIPDPQSALAGALRRSRKIDLTVPAPGGPGAGGIRQMAAALEQVGSDEFIISQPMLAGSAPGGRGPGQSLLAGQVVEARFRSKGGYFRGESKVLGPVEITTGGSGSIKGYRMSLPMALSSAERRRDYRVLVGLKLGIDGTLAPLVPGNSATGNLIDLSAGGAKLRFHKAPPWLQSGEMAVLLVTLPDPVGALEEQVRICSVKSEGRSGAVHVGLAFQKEVGGLAQLIRLLDIRNAEATRRAG